MKGGLAAKNEFRKGLLAATAHPDKFDCPSDLDAEKPGKHAWLENLEADDRHSKIYQGRILQVLQSH